MRRLLAAARRRRLLVGAGAAFALLAGIAGATPGAFGGYKATITNSTDTAASASYFQCVGALGADKTNAVFQWALSDGANAMTAADISGKGDNGKYAGNVATDVASPIACPRDGGTAWKLDGTSSLAYYPTATNASIPGPTTFTIEVFFKTTVKAGVLIGFGSSMTTGSGSYDRHLYINTDGAVVFGVGSAAVTSPGAVTDGIWHHVAGTFTGGTLNLYLDGKSVGTASGATAQSYSGFWHVGYNSIAGWAKAPSTGYFTGSMRGASVYSSALTAGQIQSHAIAGS